MEYTVIIMLLSGFLVLSSSISTLQNQVSRMNTKLDKIAKHIGLEEPNIDDELLNLIAQGEKIKAIKKLREFSGLGLKEAKEYVDKL